MRFHKVFFLSALLFLSSSTSADWFENKLFSPEGTLIVAAIGGFISGVGNFVGGLRWNIRAGTTDEKNAQIQEAGWLLCSPESFVFTFAIPVWGYAWLKRQTKASLPTEPIIVK